jgi:hypothetical protein
MSKLGSAMSVILYQVIGKCEQINCVKHDSYRKNKSCTTNIGHWILDIDYWILKTLMFYKIV